MEHLLDSAEKLFHNRYMIAIKKAFTITLPVIVLGSIASLINNIPVGFIQDFLTTGIGQIVRSVNGAIWLGSTAVMAILIAWTLSYYLGMTYQLNRRGSADVRRTFTGNAVCFLYCFCKRCCYCLLRQRSG